MPEENLKDSPGQRPPACGAIAGTELVAGVRAALRARQPDDPIPYVLPADLLPASTVGLPAQVAAANHRTAPVQVQTVRAALPSAATCRRNELTSGCKHPASRSADTDSGREFFYTTICANARRPTTAGCCPVTIVMLTVRKPARNAATKAARWGCAVDDKAHATERPLTSECLRPRSKGRVSPAVMEAATA